MKKKMKLLGLVLSMLMLSAAVLTGCGGSKVTAEDLVKEVNTNMKNAKSMTADMKMEMVVAFASSGISMDLTLNLDASLESITADNTAHMKGTMSMSLMGMSMDLESYNVKEDGQMVTYSSSAGEWTKTTVDEAQIQSLNNMDSLFADGITYTLADKTEKVGGVEVYILNAKIPADKMTALFGDVSSEMTESMGMNWSASEANVIMKVDKKTKMPVEVTADFGDGITMNDGGDESMNVKKMVITITYTGFDNVTEIVVPDSVKNSAASDESGSNSGLEGFLEGGESDPIAETQGTEEETEEEVSYIQNPDGTYTVSDWSDEFSVVVGTPEGYSLSDISDRTWLYFVDGSADASLTYRVTGNGNTTDDDFKDDAQYNYDYMAKNPETYTTVEMSDIQSVKVGDLEVKYIRTNYTYDGDLNCVDYITWADLGDGRVVQCEVEESKYKQACTLIGKEEALMNTAYSAVQK